MAQWPPKYAPDDIIIKRRNAHFDDSNKVINYKFHQGLRYDRKFHVPSRTGASSPEMFL